MRGLVALGDSITRGSGEAMLGLRMQSWALWLAEALELPYSCFARDGARAADVLAEQVPRLRGRYELGCLYVGVNDVRTPGFQLRDYTRALGGIVAVLAACCERLLLVGLPPRIGAPPAPRWAIEGAGAALAAQAEQHGALLLSLEQLPVGPLRRSGLRAAELVQPDLVHLTARGEAWIALRAAELLVREGWTAQLAGEGPEPQAAGGHSVPQLAPLHEALRPLGAGAWARWLLAARLPATLRDVRRRVGEGTLRTARE